jgi:hypothetical protein
VHHPEIARLFEASGPFTSIYLATHGEGEQAAEQVALRWKNLRGQLADRGAREATLAAVDPLVEGNHTAGATLAVIAGADGILLSTSLPEPPGRPDAVARHGPLPDVLPLLASAQSRLPHVAVLTDRTGAEIAARVADSERTEHVEGTVAPHIHKPQAGGWSQPRYHHRAEALWESNAGTVADALTRVVDQVRPRFVAAAGDVRALQLLREQAPKRVRTRMRVVGGEYASLAAVFRAAEELLAETVATDAEALLGRFAEERGQGDRAVEGAAATLQALGRGQIETLLVAADPDDERTAWFGRAPTEAAAERGALAAMGVAAAVEGRLVDVAVRAALGTGAAVHVLDPDRQGAPHDGLAGLLRFAAAAP